MYTVYINYALTRGILVLTHIFIHTFTNPEKNRVSLCLRYFAVICLWGLEILHIHLLYLGD